MCFPKLFALCTEATSLKKFHVKSYKLNNRNSQINYLGKSNISDKKASTAIVIPFISNTVPNPFHKTETP